MISGCHYLCDRCPRSQYSSHYITYVVVKDDIKLHFYAKTNQGLARRTRPRLRRYSTLRILCVDLSIAWLKHFTIDY